MTEGDGKVLSTRDKKFAMSDSVYAQDLIREAFPAQRHGSVKSAQYAAYRYVRSFVAKDFTIRRVRSIWEGKARRIDNEEAEALRRALIEEGKNEYKHLLERLENLEAAIALVDPDFISATLAARRSAPGGMGSGNRPGTHGT